jgi:YYY domain-containing protein
MLAVLIWWLALQLIGLLALPLALRLLRGLPDRGFGFARPLGLLLAGYLFWLLVTLGVLQNTRGSILLVLLMLGAASGWLWLRHGREASAFLRARWRVLLATELLFLVTLALFSLFRAYNPNIEATEKPMEFGFINAILRSRTFPPRDMWLSGYAISYYYLGYVIVALLTRLTGLASDVTFNLTVATLFALTATGAFSLVYNLVQAYRERVRPADARQAPALLSGLLGAVLVPLMGNLEGIFEIIRARGWGSEALFRWLDVKNLGVTSPSSTWYPTDIWWWWRASRVVHDRDALGNSVEVIDEFPFFSFLLGDNHPHVLALPFVLLALALALNVLLRPRDETEVAPTGDEQGWWQRACACVGSLWRGRPVELVLVALLLGGLGFLNTWDYPIYLVVLVLAYAARRWIDERPALSRWVVDVAALGALLLAVGVVLYLPFYLSFRSQAGGIGAVGDVKTRLHQYGLMFGVFLFFVMSLLGALAWRYWRSSRLGRAIPLLGQVAGAVLLVLAIVAALRGWWTAGLVFALLMLDVVLLVWGAQPRGDAERPAPRLPESVLFALLLALMGLALTVSVEFIYLRDTFGSRMNTVFKFYYQGWVLLGLASAFGAYYVAERLTRRRGTGRIVALGAWGLLGVVLVCTGLSYTVTAAVAKAEGFSGSPTLDGTRYIAQWRADDYAAVHWLRAHAPENAVMVEAPGGSYTEYNWVSAHSGVPTLLGWGGHELQWRGSYDEPRLREPAIAIIYQSTDAAETQRVITAYGIDYVYVGRLERAKYQVGQAMMRKFDRMMTRVFEQGDVVIYGHRY